MSTDAAEYTQLMERVTAGTLCVTFINGLPRGGTTAFERFGTLPVPPPPSPPARPAYLLLLPAPLPPPAPLLLSALRWTDG